MFRLLWKNKFLILFLAALIFLLPQSLSRQAQMLNKTLLTSVGLDIVGMEYVLSGEMVVNQSGEDSGRKSEIITAKGASVGEALNNMTVSQGREVSLAHCTLILLGSGLEDENLTELLKYFLNKAELNNSCLLMYTTEDVAKVMEGNIRENDSRGNLLQQISEFSGTNVVGFSTNLESFFKDNLRTTASSVLSMFESENTISAAVFQNGKFLFSLSFDKAQSLNFLQPASTAIRLLCGEEVLQVLSKKFSINSYFENDKPCVDIKIQTELQPEINPNIQGFALETLAYNVRYDIETRLKDTLSECYEKGADILNIYERLLGRHTVRLEHFLETDTKENLLNLLEFNIEVDAKIIT